MGYHLWLKMSVAGPGNVSIYFKKYTGWFL